MAETEERGNRRFDRAIAAVAAAVTLSLLATAFWPPSLADAPESVRFLGRLHPMLVHLPIGFLLALFVLEALDLFVRSVVLHHATYVMAWLAAFAAVFAVGAGTILALPGGYSEELLSWHRWLGAATAVCAVWILAWKVCRSPREPHGWSFAYHPLLVATAALLAGAGHYGGSLTHGSDYLTAYMPEGLRGLIGLPERAAPVAIEMPDDPADAIVFTSLIQPVFQTNCVSCHGVERQRGGLRLDSFAHLIKGGESGPDAGLIARSLTFPIDDERRMPPRERPQLSEDEIALITWWVRNGAPEGARVRDLATTAQIDRILEERFGLVAVEETLPMLDWEEIQPLVAKLAAELGVGIRRVSRDTAAIEIPFMGTGAAFSDHHLARLSPLAPNFRTLNLARTGITNAGLATVAEMKNLVRLDLSNTEIGDEGLAHLTGLPRLHYVNLYGTRITDDGLAHLKNLPALRQAYLWQTAVTEAGAARLRESLVDELEVESWRTEIRELERRIAAARVEIDVGQDSFSRGADDSETAAEAEAEVESAAEAEEESAAAALNETCPVSGRPADPAHTVVHEERTIAFCCGNCVARFTENPTAFLE